MRSVQLAFHNTDIVISSHEEKIFDWIENCYTSYSHSFPAAQRFTFNWHLEAVQSGDAISMSTPTNGALTGFGLLDSPCQFKDHLLFVSPSQSNNGQALVMDRKAKTLQANLGSRLFECEETFLYDVMQEFLKKLIYPWHHWVSIHASTVKFGNKVICLAGDKGSGKSTTAIKLVQDGYRIISDDSPILFLKDGRVHALSSLDGVSVTRETLAVLPELQNHLGRQRQISGKYFLSNSWLADAIEHAPGPVTHLVLLRRRPVAVPTFLTWHAENLMPYLMQQAFLYLMKPSGDISTKDLFDSTNSVFSVITTLMSQTRSVVLEYDDSHLSSMPDLLASI